MCEYTLTVQVDGQTVVEERWGQVDTYSTTAHASGLQGTVVVQEACADAVRHLEGFAARNIATRDAGVDFLGEGSAVDLVLPFGTRGTQCSHGIGIVTIVGHEEIAESLRAEHVNLLGHGLECTAHVNVDAGLCTSLTLLGGDQDHTVRSTATVNSGGRSILQNRETLDVVRVDGVQHVTT